MTYTYHFKAGNNNAMSLLLLHGTGGDEHDLVPLATEIVGDDVTLLSPRGDVNEYGQLRFFTRNPDGTFDQDDLIKRTNALADFIREACRKHDIHPSTLYALGYSNGANMIASLMFLHPDVLAGGILLRSFLPLDNPPQADVSGKNMLILSGIVDQILPPEKGQELATKLEQGGANVTFNARLAGHELRREDIDDTKAWLKKLGFDF